MLQNDVSILNSSFEAKNNHITLETCRFVLCGLLNNLTPFAQFLKVLLTFRNVKYRTFLVFPQRNAVQLFSKMTRYVVEASAKDLLISKKRKLSYSSMKAKNKQVVRKTCRLVPGRFSNNLNPFSQFLPVL